MPSKSSGGSPFHRSDGFQCKSVRKLINQKFYLSSKTLIASSSVTQSVSSHTPQVQYNLEEISNIINIETNDVLGPEELKDKATQTAGNIVLLYEQNSDSGIFKSNSNILSADCAIKQHNSDNCNPVETITLDQLCETEPQTAEVSQPITSDKTLLASISNHHLLAKFVSKHHKQKCDGSVTGKKLLRSKICKNYKDKSERYITTDISTESGLTIKKIHYKCAVLLEHSQKCGCSTPRLHVYLSFQHRCSSCCQVPSVDKNPIGDTITMTGRAVGKPRSRKSLNPQKLSEIMATRPGRIPALNPEAWAESMKEKDEEISTVMSSNKPEEPESELLVEECESLPTIMNTFSGGVEYIILDDSALNLCEEVKEKVSPDVLKCKIDNIYQDIDVKPDIHALESKLQSSREVKSKLLTDRRISENSNPLVEVKTENMADEGLENSSLAEACTNRCPSIKDIFGDIIIKEEPLDIKTESDMTVDDFSKEMNIAAGCEMNKLNGAKLQTYKTVASDLGEPSGNGLFSKLIKEETKDEIGNTKPATDNEEMTMRKMTSDNEDNAQDSDDSLGPLQIDEDHLTWEDNVQEAHKMPSELQVPSVNIISPFKIKILFSAPRQEPIRQQVAQPSFVASNNINLVKKDKLIPKNGVVAVNRKEQGSENNFINNQIVLPPVGNNQRTVNFQLTPSLTCMYCGTVCQDIHAMAAHVEDHQKDGLIICYFCQRSFGDKTGMRRHMRTHTGEKPYQCDVCGKRFSLPGNFKKHRDIHEDRRTEPCGVCGKTFRRKEHLKYHMRTHTGEKPYSCSECGASFTARYSLQIHMNIHLGKRPYKCSYCNKAFSDKSTMRKHLRVHTGEKPFHCEECGRCFGESGTLAAHMATHRSDRPFRCDKCRLSFKTTGGLRQHEKVHTGEKQFGCKYCGMKFLLKYNMTMHERIHTGEKPYTCSHCQRSFRSRSCLAKHIVLHGGDEERRYHCDHCSSRFYRKAHLRRHIDMHLGIKNYKCDHCSKKFCTRATLKSHLQTFHSQGARRFPCNWCGKVFKRQIYVSTHECSRTEVKIERDGAEEPTSQKSEGEIQQIFLDNENSINSDASSIEVKSEPEDEFFEEEDDYDDDDEDEIDIGEDESTCEMNKEAMNEENRTASNDPLPQQSTEIMAHQKTS